jgi:hypothetical protein
MLSSQNCSNVQAHRTLALECLTDCAVAYTSTQVATSTLVATGVASTPAFTARLQKMLDPVLFGASKGTFSSSPEQLASLQRLCVGCMPHAPQYVVEKLLVGLLAAESWEVVLVGLRASLDIMLRSTHRLQESAFSESVRIHSVPCRVQRCRSCAFLPHLQLPPHISVYPTSGVRVTKLASQLWCFPPATRSRAFFEPRLLGLAHNQPSGHARVLDCRRALAMCSRAARTSLTELSRRR